MLTGCGIAGAIEPRQVLITGSTSVYAQIDGLWVDETSETKPDRETGRILLEAEGIALDAGGLVARLSGLYGPGRSVIMRKFLSGGRLSKEMVCAGSIKSTATMLPERVVHLVQARDTGNLQCLR